MQADIEAEVARQKSRWNDHEEAAAQNAAANGLEYQKETVFRRSNRAICLVVPGGNTSRIDAGNIDTHPLEAILAQYGLLQDLLDINNQKTKSSHKSKKPSRNRA